MKHVNYFDDFLKVHVNLNQDRLNRLDRGVNSVTDLLKYRLEEYRKYSPQGSYAQGTIIKPVQDNDEFDADILVFLRDDSFHPCIFSRDYVRELNSIFRNDNTYADKVRLKTRCVTIDYVGEFHIDVVPCIEYNGQVYICNRLDKIYEETDGDGYRRWLTDKNRIVGSNGLKKTIRLLKFLRDHKDNFTIPSIQLTTLAGNSVDDIYNELDLFIDLPTTLKTISNRIDSFLQNHPYMPEIKNPVLPSENFNRKWDERKYRNFREKFYIYNDRINQAYYEKDHNKSVRLWREIFGDQFGSLKHTSKTAATAGAAGLVSTSVYATKPYSYRD